MEKIVLLTILLVVLFFYKKLSKENKEQKKEIEESVSMISHLEKVLRRISPNLCEAISPETGYYCLMPTTHYYGGEWALCTSCAEKFIANGANPAPYPIAHSASQKIDAITA